MNSCWIIQQPLTGLYLDSTGWSSDYRSVLQYRTREQAIKTIDSLNLSNANVVYIADYEAFNLKLQREAEAEVNPIPITASIFVKGDDGKVRADLLPAKELP